MKYNYAITSYNEVEKYKDKNITHVISLNDKRTNPPDLSSFNNKDLKIIRFRFHDISSVDVNGPQIEDIQKLIDFATGLKEKLEKGDEVNTLFHCWAGVSRSTCAAYIVLNVLIGPGKENECLKHVLFTRGFMRPNEYMAKLADNLLNRNGALYDPVKEWSKQFI